MKPRGEGRGRAARPPGGDCTEIAVPPMERPGSTPCLPAPEAGALLVHRPRGVITGPLSPGRVFRHSLWVSSPRSVCLSRGHPATIHQKAGVGLTGDPAVFEGCVAALLESSPLPSHQDPPALESLTTEQMQGSEAGGPGDRHVPLSCSAVAAPPTQHHSACSSTYK